MTREELIQELQKHHWSGGATDFGEYDNSDEIADFILSREKLLLEKIGKPLRENILKYPLDPKFPADRVNYSDAKLAVLECLAIIEKEGSE